MSSENHLILLSIVALQCSRSHIWSLFCLGAKDAIDEGGTHGGGCKSKSERPKRITHNMKITRALSSWICRRSVDWRGTHFPLVAARPLPSTIGINNFCSSSWIASDSSIDSVNHMRCFSHHELVCVACSVIHLSILNHPGMPKVPCIKGTLGDRTTSTKWLNQWLPNGERETWACLSSNGNKKANTFFSKYLAMFPRDARSYLEWLLMRGCIESIHMHYALY